MALVTPMVRSVAPIYGLVRGGQTLNLVPTINAGTDQSVIEQSSVVLTGSGSDSDGTITSYSWLQTGGAPQVTLGGANTATASFIHQQ